MKKEIKVLAICTFLILSALCSQAQSKPVNNLRKQNDRSVSFMFLYESMLRAGLQQVGDSIPADWFEDLRMVVICTSEKSNERHNPELIEDFHRDLAASGFVEMFAMKKDGNQITFLQSKPEGGREHMMIIADSELNWTAVDVTGSINFGAIMSEGPGALDKIMDLSKFF